MAKQKNQRAPAENKPKKASAKRVATKATKPQRAVAKSSARKTTTSAKPKLLSGGNPQIAKAYAPMQAYIAAMPGWKQGRYDPSLPAIPSKRKCATSTSMRTISSTKHNLPLG